MPPIVRPRYSEGQVLGAADLEAQVTYNRTDSAIHERTEHSPGIAAGLGLVLREEQAGVSDVRFGQLWVEAGVAVDASGRRIVVAQEERITERDFINAGVFSVSDDPLTARYPVFLVAIDEPVNGARAAGRCGVDAPTRTAESFQLEFGRPGSERAVVQPTTAAGPSDGPGTGGKVLLGFATWNKDVTPGGGFTGALRDAAFGVRYAGVRASSVIPHRGRLLLTTGETDPRFVLLLSQDELGAAQLLFGRQQGTAAPQPLFAVDDKGDVVVAGKINSAIPQLPVQIAGSLSHGLRLPLPASISEEMVASGRVTLQSIVTPHLPNKTPQTFQTPTGPLSAEAFATPIECWVDGGRRLHCRFLWRPITGTASDLVTGGTADYFLTATPVE